jgi:hypothetical protein
MGISGLHVFDTGTGIFILADITPGTGDSLNRFLSFFPFVLMGPSSSSSRKLREARCFFSSSFLPDAARVIYRVSERMIIFLLFLKNYF